MTQIITELDKYNQLYELDIHQKNRMNDIPVNINDSTLSSYHKYELALNQDWIDLNRYENLEQSIINWIDVEDFNLSKDELIIYINTRIKTNLSIDRIYFFYELIYYYCEQKDKKTYALKLIKSLKICLLYKSKNNVEMDLLLRLLARFIIICERFKIENKIFINEILEEYLFKLNENNDFYISMYFYEFIFDKYNKKSYCYSLIESTFEKFANRIDLELISKGYLPYKNYGTNLADIFHGIKKHKKKLYFYKKDIDNTLLYCSKFEDNTMNKQSYLKDMVNISKKSENYKLAEIKLLFKKISQFISENYNKFFSVLENEEITKSNLEYYNSVEFKYKKIANNAERLDYIIFVIFHESFNLEQFNKHKENQKKSNKGFLSEFFPDKVIIDHKGYIYDIKDNEIFSFFQFLPSLQNNLYLYLDYHHNWIKESEEVILKSIKNLNLSDNNFKTQFSIAVKSFCNEDYISFMYITPTLIELMLKKFLEKIEGELLSSSGLNLTERTMNEIIQVLIEDKNSYLDNSILQYVSYVLVNKEGLNLRNNIAHGNFNDYTFNKYNAMYIYIIFIYFIRYFENDKI